MPDMSSELEEQIRELLDSGRLDEAVALMADDVNPRQVELARLILSITPGILSDLPAESMPILRREAVMMELTGSRARDLLRKVKLEHRLDAQIAANMLIFAAQHRLTVREAFDGGWLRSFMIDGIEDNCHCRPCRGFKRPKWRPIEELARLELPHPKCTSERGCRCVVILSDRPARRKKRPDESSEPEERREAIVAAGPLNRVQPLNLPRLFGVGLILFLGGVYLVLHVVDPLGR